jgi:hypothetical protein
MKRMLMNLAALATILVGATDLAAAHTRAAPPSRFAATADTTEGVEGGPSCCSSPGGVTCCGGNGCSATVTGCSAW